jgi:hypothetical protein
MPVHIVMEQARTRHFAWVRRVVETSLGLVLLIAAWAALFALTAIIVLSGEAGSGSDKAAHVSGTDGAGVGVLAAVVLIGMTVGHRLIGRSRRLVLFLRRFGYTDATEALTFAASRAIGRSWRLVTLDDAAVAPVGVSKTTAKLSAVGEFGSGWALRILMGFAIVSMWALGLGVVGMGAAIGYTALHHRPVLTMVDHALGHHTGHAHGPAAVFATCFTVTIVGAAAGMFFAFANLLATLLFQPWHIVGVLLNRAREAEVTNVASIEAARTAARSIRRQARKVFSARLMVLHVDNDVWQPTVTTVADIASIVLIDVSEPTENLLWEIAQVERDPETACVLVGNAERVRRLQTSTQPLDRQLVAVLDGRTILAYESTEPGLRRFGSALRATLERAVA